MDKSREGRLAVTGCFTLSQPLRLYRTTNEDRNEGEKEREIKGEGGGGGRRQGGGEQGLSSYTVHRDMVCHLIPFTVIKSVIPFILKGVCLGRGAGGWGGGTKSVILSLSP